MRRLPRWSRVVLSLAAVLAAVLAAGVAWNQRADDLCREDAPTTADGYTVSWDWGELAYVCDYGMSREEPKRIGLIDAFHGDGRRH